MDPFSSTTPHVTTKDLQAFSLGTLSSEASHRISDHLAFCARCRLAFADVMTTIDVSASGSSISEESPQEATADDSQPGLKIPGYGCLERIGQGGMGTVFAAIRAHTSERVAIKFIRPRQDNAYSSDRKKRLVREASALTRIEHPNIVQALEVIVINDSPAMVMEYIQGQPLHRWIREHKPGYQIAALFVKQLAEAIAYAHERGVVHCDLKPQNILVSTIASQPCLKIIDFGLAKIGDEDWSITCSGDVLGTPAYMAPEQTSGTMLQANPAIDIYGLGAVFYELLTGRPPFEAPTSALLLSKVARQMPERPGKVRPEIPRSLDLICLKCLEKRPQDRYQSAQQLAEDLQAFLDNRSIVVREPSVLTQLRRVVRANSKIFLTLLVLGLFAVVSGVSLFYLWQEWRASFAMRESLTSAVTEKQDAMKRAEQAEEVVLEELRISLEETTERLFGATAAREDAEWDALDRLAQRWTRFADQLDDSKTSQLARAEAHMRVGSIHASLGELAVAEEKLQLVLDTFPDVFPDPFKESCRLAVKAESYRQLAKCFYNAGKMSESEEAFQGALASIKEAINLQPDDLKNRLLQTRILGNFGTMLTRTSRVEEAQQKLMESITILEALGESKKLSNDSLSDSRTRKAILEQLWFSRNDLAHVLRMQGGVAQAIRLLESASLPVSEMEERSVDNPVLQRLIFTQRVALGLCQLELGQFEKCRSSFVDAMFYQKKLNELYPRRQDFQKDYGSLCGSLAVVSIRLSRPEEALSHITESLRVNSDLADRFPDRPEYLSEKAKSLTNLVAILASINRLDEAIGRGGELIKLHSKLYEEHPNHDEYAYAFAASLNIVATLHGKAGSQSDALTNFDRSHAVYTDLLQRNPAVVAYRMGLANMCFAKAEWSRHNQAWQTAIDAYSSAIETINCTTPQSPRTESNLLASAYLGRAVVLRTVGRFDESRASAQFGVDTIEPWKNTTQQSQEVHHRCLDLATRSDD